MNCSVNQQKHVDNFIINHIEREALYMHIQMVSPQLTIKRAVHIEAEIHMSETLSER